MAKLQWACIERWPLYRGRLQRFSATHVLVLFGAREAGCIGEVAALHSDNLRQVSLYWI